MNDLTRIPPQDRAAEVCVLGAMILDASTIDEAQTIVGKDDFYAPQHGLIFDVLAKMRAADKPVDLVTLKNAALEAGVLDQIGGVDYLMELVDGVPATSNVGHYARIVKAMATKRAILQHSCRLTAAAYDASITADELLARAEAGLDAVTTGQADDRLTSAHEAAESVLRDVQTVQAGDMPPGVMTGLRAIDTACGGLRPGEHLAPGAGPYDFSAA